MSGVPQDDYRVLNTEATIGLARAAEKARAKRFVFLSSIRAQSGPTADGRAHRSAWSREPTDAYGRSKLDAELGLARLGIDWVALRPVLVYGPGVKGNMAALVRLARSPYPLPLGGLPASARCSGSTTSSPRSTPCCAAPAPLRRPLIVADPEPLTVAEMIAAHAPGARPPARRLPGAAGAHGSCVPGDRRRSEAFARLAGSLVASPSALRRLGWVPPAGTRAGLAALARSSGADG